MPITIKTRNDNRPMTSITYKKGAHKRPTKKKTLDPHTLTPLAKFCGREKKNEISQNVALR